MSKKLKKGLAAFGFLAMLALVAIYYFCQCIVWAPLVDDYSTSEIIHLSTRAQNGDAKSQEVLGRAYRLGDGVEKNYATAVKWLTQSAEQGNTQVLYDLATIYRNGDTHINQDFGEAYFWYSVAIIRGETSNLSRRDAIIKHLTKEQILSLDKRVVEWLKLHSIHEKPQVTP